MEYARRKKLYDPIAIRARPTLNYEKSHFDKLVASLLPLMEKLIPGRTASLALAGARRSDRLATGVVWTSVIHLGGTSPSGSTRSPTSKCSSLRQLMFAVLSWLAGSL